MRTLIATTLLTLAAAAATAAEPAYNEAADARAEVQQAIAAAQAAKVPALLVFGANWCPDCRVLDLAFKEGTAAPLIAKDFRVVKVDVGRFNKNVDLAEQYGVTLKKGIPAVAVVGADGKPLYVTKEGELSNARSMGDAGIHDFFKKVAAQTSRKG